MDKYQTQGGGVGMVGNVLVVWMQRRTVIAGLIGHSMYIGSNADLGLLML